MKVLIVGSGAREHALTWAVDLSPLVEEVLVAPGNAGTASRATNYDIAAEDVDGLVRLARREAVDLVVIGPEGPLARGLVDRLMDAGIRAFGPSRAAARIESSKSFAKELMQANDIPTPGYQSFDDVSKAIAYVRDLNAPVVVKAEGLAAGKGVIVCENVEDAETALSAIMVEKVFGEAGRRVIVEERLAGNEVSILAFTDGKTVVTMPPVRDHKRVFDRDQGPNTGGMGAYSPPPDVKHNLVEQVRQRVLEPAVQALAAQGTPFVGVIYAGMILTRDGPKTLEFNCRFGDPEAQVILLLLEADLVEIMLACIEGRLDEMDIRWKEGAAATIVLAAPGYPQAFPTGMAITGVKQANSLRDVYVFQAGTTTDTNGQLVTNGGRVVAVTAVGRQLEDAIRKAYGGAAQIHFEGAHYRRDIGREL